MSQPDAMLVSARALLPPPRRVLPVQGTGYYLDITGMSSGSMAFLALILLNSWYISHTSTWGGFSAGRYDGSSWTSRGVRLYDVEENLWSIPIVICSLVPQGIVGTMIGEGIQSLEANIWMPRCHLKGSDVFRSPSEFSWNFAWARAIFFAAKFF